MKSSTGEIQTLPPVEISPDTFPFLYTTTLFFDMFKPAPIKPLISFKEFSKLDVRVGTILLVEDIPKSKNLVRLTVDFGDHTKNILVGMKNERENSF